MAGDNPVPLCLDLLKGLLRGMNQIKELKLFKRHVKLNLLSFQHKIDLLREFADSNWISETSPASYPELRQQSRKWPIKGKCRVCLTDRAYCYHHIIPLGRGGQNKMFNRIKICRTCHKLIHPWID
jgi:hypothetical protein